MKQTSWLKIGIFLGTMLITHAVWGQDFGEVEAVFDNIEQGSNALLKKLFVISGILGCGYFIVRIHAGMGRLVSTIVGAILFVTMPFLLEICFRLAG